MYILGISAFYHDSAACLLNNGEIVGAVQEERFSRVKHDQNLPLQSINHLLKESGLKDINKVNHIVFYDKPLIKFERLLETYLSYAPLGFQSFIKAMPVWLREKLHIRKLIREQLKFKGKVLFAQHHESHAASAFFPSPFNEAVILCLDGVGEWSTTTIWEGKDNKIKLIKELKFPHSLGLLYSAFTYYCGFKVNSGEYKLMGLAPYGKPIYVDLILDKLVDLKSDGSFKLDMKYFNYCHGLTMINSKFEKLFKIKRRSPEGDLTQHYMDIAASIQKVTEKIMIMICKFAILKTGKKNLCLAGGVALNCVGNGKIQRNLKSTKIWIQPASGDAGGALGCAQLIWHQFLNKKRVIKKPDGMKGSYLGPSYSSDFVKENLKDFSVVYHFKLDNELLPLIAKEIDKGAIVGWFNGKMEFGPRALGARSILGDARVPDMQKKMNLKIKFRESFRPFAPAVLAENLSEWFDINISSPYMLLVSEILDKHKIALTEKDKENSYIDLLNIPKSKIPAVTHIDYSSRIQTVHKETNPRFYKLISEFKKITGCPILVNTSFNVRGEPIVCTPRDAYICFMRTEIDILVIDNYLFFKEEQPPFKDLKNWRNEFALD